MQRENPYQHRDRVNHARAPHTVRRFDKRWRVQRVYLYSESTRGFDVHRGVAYSEVLSVSISVVDE